MHLNNDDLPGRFDKPIWAMVLIVTGPLGLWAFKTYRAERWVSPAEAKSPHAPAADLL